MAEGGTYIVVDGKKMLASDYHAMKKAQKKPAPKTESLKGEK